VKNRIADVRFSRRLCGRLVAGGNGYRGSR